MTEIIKKELYKGDVKINFYPKSHRYKVEGEKTWLPSVTSITGIIDKSRVLIPWAVNLDFDWLQDKVNEFASKNTQIPGSAVLFQLIEEARKQHNIKKEEAADIGTAIHAFAEAFGGYKLGKCECPQLPIKAPVEVKNGISAFLEWYNTNNVEFLECERFVYSKDFGYVGLTDAVIKLGDKKYVVDYKSAKYIYDEAKLQVAAYTCAYIEEMTEEVAGSLILRFGKENGELEVHETPIEDVYKNFDAFRGCLIAKNRLKELQKKTN